MADTIAAIATAMTASGIGIIRMSGPESRGIVRKVTVPKAAESRLTRNRHTPFTMGLSMTGRKRLMRCWSCSWTAPEAIPVRIRWRLTATAVFWP